MSCAKSDVLTTAWQPRVKGFGFQHGESQRCLMESPLDSPLQVCTMQENPDKQEASVKNCQTTGWRGPAWQHSASSLMLKNLTSLPDLTTQAPMAGRPASLSLCPVVAAPGDVKPSRKSKGGEFQGRKL